MLPTSQTQRYMWQQSQIQFISPSKLKTRYGRSDTIVTLSSTLQSIGKDKVHRL